MMQQEIGPTIIVQILNVKKESKSIPGHLLEMESDVRIVSVLFQTRF